MQRWRGIPRIVLYCLKDKPLNCFALPLPPSPPLLYYTIFFISEAMKLTGIELENELRAALSLYSHHAAELLDEQSDEHQAESA